jgi:hypothetical protein
LIILLFKILSKKYSVAGFLNYLIFCGPGSLNLLVMFSNLKVSLSFFSFVSAVDCSIVINPSDSISKAVTDFFEMFSYTHDTVFAAPVFY